MIATDIHKGNWGNKIFKKGKWYLLSSIFTKGLSILLLPVYTYYLSTEEFGILQTLSAVAGILPMFISLALDRAFARLFHDYKKSKEQVAVLLSTIYWFILAYGFFVIFLCIISSGFWFENLFELPAYPYIFLSFIPVLLNQLSLLGKGIFEATLKTKRLATIDAVSSIIGGGISVLLMAIWHLGIIGRLSGMALASVYLIVFYTWFLIKNEYLIFSFSRKIFIESIKYSAPLIPYVASVWIGTLSDRLILSFYGGFETVGIYSLAFQLATIIYVLGDGFTRVTGVLITSGLIVDEKKTVEKISIYSFTAWIFMLASVLGIFLFSLELVWVVAPKAYSGAYILIPIITITYVFGIQSRFFTDILSVYKKTGLITFGIILSASFNLIFNLIFIPFLGAVGAALATAFSGFIAFIFYFFKSQKLIKINFLINKMVINFIVISIFVIIISYSGINDFVSVGNFILKIFVYLGYIVICFLLNKTIINQFLKGIFNNVEAIPD